MTLSEETCLFTVSEAATFHALHHSCQVVPSHRSITETVPTSHYPVNGRTAPVSDWLCSYYVYIHLLRGILVVMLI